MTKLRKPNTIEFALQNALKNLTEEELKSATNKSKSHFFKCGDPDDQHHTLSINDALSIDELLLKKAKGTPLFDAISTNLHAIINQANYFENINSILESELKNSTNIFLLGAIDKIENYLPAFINEFKLNIQRSLDVKL